jgi:hypothetical protein
MITDTFRELPQAHITAAVAAKSDHPGRVTGPVEREACRALFTHPVMQKVLERWRAGWAGHGEPARRPHGP